MNLDVNNLYGWAMSQPQLAGLLMRVTDEALLAETT